MSEGDAAYQQGYSRGMTRGAEAGHARAERAERFARAWKALAKRRRGPAQEHRTYCCGFADGAAEERARIVAWLRERADALYSTPPLDYAGSGECHSIADAIERGEHLKETP